MKNASATAHDFRLSVAFKDAASLWEYIKLMLDKLSMIIENR